MKTLKPDFKTYSERFNALSLRERLLLLIAMLALLIIGWNQFLWEPLKREQNRLVTETGKIKEQVKMIDLQLKGLMLRHSRDPNPKMRDSIAGAKLALTQQQARIEGLTRTLVEPEQMASLLEEFLIRNGSLQLVTLETLKTTALISPEESATVNQQEIEKPLVNLYRHAFIIEFEGDYFATLEYLRALEMLPRKFFWEGVTFRVETYPRAKVRLQLYTLSLAEGWIGV